MCGHLSRTNTVVFPPNLEITICTNMRLLFEFIAKERSTNIHLILNSVCSTSACPRDAFLHRTRLLLTSTVNQQAAHLMSPPSIWGGFSSGRLCLLRPHVCDSIAGSPPHGTNDPVVEHKPGHMERPWPGSSNSFSAKLLVRRLSVIWEDARQCRHFPSDIFSRETNASAIVAIVAIVDVLENWRICKALE